MFVAFFGFLAGFVSIPFFTHWLRLVLTAMGKHPGMDPSPTPKRRAAAVAFAILHPVLWLLLLGLPYGLWRLYAGSVATNWQWFFGSAVATLFGVFLLSLVLVRRAAAHLRANKV